MKWDREGRGWDGTFLSILCYFDLYICVCLCFSHYSSWDAEAVRNWRLEASTSDPLSGASASLQQWVVLSEHVNDEALNKKGATHTWLIPPTSASAAPYRAFRIRQTGVCVLCALTYSLTH